MRLDINPEGLLAQVDEGCISVGGLLVRSGWSPFDKGTLVDVEYEELNNRRPAHGKWAYDDGPIEAVMWTCTDCGGDLLNCHDYYIVRDSLWYMCGAGRRMLCTPCLERRLGRHMRFQDYLDSTGDFLAPVNQQFFEEYFYDYYATVIRPNDDIYNPNT